MQHDQNRKTKQEERRESNGGGIKEECEERSKGGRPGKKAEEEAGIWLWDTEGGMDGAWNRGMAQNLGGVEGGVDILNMIDLRGGASHRRIVN